MAADAFTSLGCCEILREVLPIDPAAVFARHGNFWDAAKIRQVLIDEFGCRNKLGAPEPGDIVLSGMHPGLVLPGSKVAQVLRGRRLVTDLKTWSIKAVLSCQYQ